MTPDQPEDSVSRPVSRGANRFTIPIRHEMDLEMRREGVVAIREADLRRYIRKIRELDGRTTVWFAAGWGVVEIAAAFAIAALTFPAHGVELGAVAILFAIAAAACFKAHRDVNTSHEDDAEELALEMEEALDPGNGPGGGAGGRPRPSEAST